MKVSSKLILIFVSLLISASQCYAQERHIHLNGEHLEPNQISTLDELFLQQVPSGYYWINEANGQWGYEGNNQPQGIVPVFETNHQSPSYSDRPDIDMSQNGRVVSGKIDGRHCTYVTVQGMSVRSCD